MVEKTPTGRIKKADDVRKKTRGISLSDHQYDKLKQLAEEYRMGPSEYIIKKLKLDKK